VAAPSGASGNIAADDFGFDSVFDDALGKTLAASPLPAPELQIDFPKTVQDARSLIRAAVDQWDMLALETLPSG
jgi:hypothetical protein